MCANFTWFSLCLIITMSYKTDTIKTRQSAHILYTYNPWYFIRIMNAMEIFVSYDFNRVCYRSTTSAQYTSAKWVFGISPDHLFDGGGWIENGRIDLSVWKKKYTNDLQHRKMSSTCIHHTNEWGKKKLHAAQQHRHKHTRLTKKKTKLFSLSLFS